MANATKVKGELTLTATERDALLHLNAALCILLDAPKALSARAKLVPCAPRDMAMMAKKIERLMEGFAQTIPDEQNRMYLNSLRMMSYTIGVKGPAGQGRRNDEYGTWISWNELNALLEGCHDHCLACSLDKYGAKKCPLRRALDVIPNDTERSDGACPYMTLI